MHASVFRKGLDLSDAVAARLAENYRSHLVERIRADGFVYRAGRLTLYLAREFGFCYGVDRAVDYAYQARERFPDRPIYVIGEIIHNPYVNARLRALGLRFLTDPGVDRASLGPGDVVILPAFGVTAGELADLDRRGCTLVDTTCGSVLNVWKSVRRYAEQGFTAVIHGKARHEETRATASQAARIAGGRYLVVLDVAEAGMVCEYIRHGGDREVFLARFRDAASPGFDPDRDLERIGLANQTTMLMSESLQVEDMFRSAVRDRYGDSEGPRRFRAFDTICTATENRQDAVTALLAAERLDLMIVIGGYNSSNTGNLARICAGRVPTFHIVDPDCLVSAGVIRHRPVGGADEVTTRGWLPATGEVAVGLTSGASTPDTLVGAAVERLAELCSEAADGPDRRAP
jgi:4-hydroxy-3-methylbut-2-en-1-yl diphosphate reductase